MADEYVVFKDVVCTKETDKALLCEIGDREVWIPKSHIGADSEVFDEDENDRGKLVVTEWIAQQKGLL